MDLKSACISMPEVALPSIEEVLGTEILIFLVSCFGILLWQGASKKRMFKKQGNSRNQNDKDSMSSGPKCEAQLMLKNKSIDESVQKVKALQDAGETIPSAWFASLCRAAIEQNSVEKLLLRVLPSGSKPMVTSEGLTAMVEEAAKLRSSDTLSALYNQAVEAKVCITSESYEAFIHGFALLGHARASRIFQQMLAKGMEPSEFAMLAILNVCADTKQICLAESIMEHCRERSGTLTLAMYAAMMKVYSNAKAFRKVCDLHAQMEKDSVTPDDTTYGQVIRSAAESGRLEMARRLFRESGNPDLLNYMSLIRAAGRERNVGKALSLLQHLEQQKSADTTAYNCVLDVCVECGDHKAAQALLERMKQNSVVDVISFNIILKSILHIGSWDDVENVLKDMRCKGFYPNKVTYNSLMNAAISNGEVHQAWKLLDRMEAEGVALDACTCSTLMKCVKISKRCSDVERVLTLIERAGVVLDEVLVADLLETCVRFGDEDGTLLSHVLQVLRDIGARPSPHAFASVIKAYGQAGKLDAAWLVWRELTIVRQLPLDQNLFVSMVEACLTNQDLGGALQVFRSLKLAFPSSSSKGTIFSMLIKACLQRKQTGLAMELYEEMDQDSSICCHLVTYNTLIDAFARAGDMAAVGKVFTSMSARGVEPDLITYSTVIKGYCVRGDLEAGIRLLGRMRQKGIEPDAVLYNSLLDGCAHQQLRKLTEKVLADMEGPGGIAPSNYTLSILVKLYGRCKDMDKLFEVVESYPAEYGFKLNAKVYTCLMSALISNGQLTQALEVFQKMKDAGSAPDAKTYQTILSGCLRQGSISSAVMLVNAALDGGYYHLESSVLQDVLMATARIGRGSDLGLPLYKRLCGCGLSFPVRIKTALQEGSRDMKSCRSSEQNWRCINDTQPTSAVV